jgi:hypothetical protein
MIHHLQKKNEPLASSASLQEVSKHEDITAVLMCTACLCVTLMLLSLGLFDGFGI